MDIRSLYLILLVLSPISALATDITIYRWTDENNTVHFSQQKPTESNIRSIEAVSIYTAVEKHNDASILDKDKIELKTSSIENTQQSKYELFNANCKSAKANLKILSSIQRVIYPDSHGKNHVLSVEEKAEEIKLNNAHIKKYCEQQT